MNTINLHNYFFLILVFTLVARAQMCAYESDDGVLDLSRPWVDNGTVPSIAVSIVNAKEIEFSAAYGQRQYGKYDQPVTLCDRYHLGSDTKAMTALLVAQLVIEGQVNWTTTLNDTLPELVAGTGYENITLSQLSSHTSGIPNDDNFPDTSNSDQLYLNASNLQLNLDEQRTWFLHQVVKLVPLKDSGQFEYSNTGYIFLGAVIEKLGKSTWEQIVTEQVFKPLNLTSAGLGCQTTLGLVDAPLAHTPVDPTGYKYFLAGPACDNPPVMGPAGTAHMSIIDFAKWAQFNLQSTSQDLKGILSIAQLDYLMNPVVSMQVKAPPPGTPPSGQYAHGWGLNMFKWATDPLIFHGGSNEKNLAYIVLDKKQSRGFVITTNAGGIKAQQALQALSESIYNWV